MALFNLPLSVIVSMILYVILIGLLMYVCVVGDPATSPITELVAVTLPRQIRKVATRWVGKDMVALIQHAIIDKALLLTYLTIQYGSWIIIFYYVYPWIYYRSDAVSNIHLLVGVLLKVSTTACFYLASTTSPGLINARTLQQYNNYSPDELLYDSSIVYKPCITTKLPMKVPRSKYDRIIYNSHVPRYDHFCGWLFNTIGQENYRFFLLFLLVHVIQCLYGSVVLTFLFQERLSKQKLLEITWVNRYTGEEIAPGHSHYLVFSYLFDYYTAEMGVLLLMVVMGLALGCFLVYHMYITSVNITTNEAMKWDDIKKYYKDSVRRYNAAVKRNDPRVVVQESFAVKPKRSAIADDDREVRCTPPIAGASEAHSRQHMEEDSELDEMEKIYHPGVYPVNMYDRGFIENWKEVLFPLSLRPEYVAKSSSGDA
jgi:palmitoyltransferase ZDHHC4